MTGTQRTSLRFGLAATVAASALLAGSTARSETDLEAEVRALRERLVQLESQMSANKRKVAAAAAVEAGDKPRSWKLPGTNTSMNIGGYVKFDALFDLNASSGDAAAIALAPAEGSTADRAGNGGSFRFHARQSRIWFQTWTPTDWGELRTYIETDFFGGGNNTFGTGFAAGTAPGVLRLRHAYGTLGPVLAGHTWTTFMPVFAGPDTLDFGGPTGQIFVRQALIRYTHNFGGGLTLEAALEDPSGDIIVGGAPAAQRAPEGVVALNLRLPTARLWAAGLLRGVEHDTGLGNNSDRELAWGAAIAATWEVHARFALGGEASVGRGYGKYLASASGFSDAILAGRNDSRTIFAHAAKGWAAFKLTDTITANAAFGWSQQDVDEEVAKAIIPAGTPHYSWSAQANLIWRPIPQVLFGVEYSHFFGSRFNSSNATISRIQVTALYRF